MKKAIVLFLLTIAASGAYASTIVLEGFSFSVLNGDLKDTAHSVDLYANGEKVLSQGACTHSDPCKVIVNKKSTLTLCNSKWINYCQTRIAFDPADGLSQRFAFIFAPSAYAAVPYTVYRPEEISIIDTQLQKQQEALREAEESKRLDIR